MSLRDLVIQAADDTTSSGSALLGIAAIITAVGVAISGVVSSVIALIRAFRAPTIHQSSSPRDDEEEDE